MAKPECHVAVSAISGEFLQQLYLRLQNKHMTDTKRHQVVSI